MGVYSKFKSAKAAGGARNYFQEGNHRLLIKSTKIDKSRKNVEFFAAEMIIVTTDSPLAVMQPNQPVDWMTMSDKDAYEGNVKQFFSAAFNVTEQSIDDMPDEDFEEMMELLVGTQQGAAGRFIECNVTQVLTKAGTPFNAVRWMPVPDEEQPNYDLDAVADET